jgi:hypothetical protein
MEEVKRGRKEVKEIKYYITKAGLWGELTLWIVCILDDNYNKYGKI